ncbi:MAG: hypothetical protein B6D42_00695, partial [Anaerolineae bacterium UTCFX5]
GGRTVFTAEGTQVMLRWQGDALTVTVNGAATAYTGGGAAWVETLIASAPFGGRFDVAVEGGAALLDTVIVRDDRAIAVGAAAAGVIGMACVAGIAVFIRRRRRALR